MGRAASLALVTGRTPVRGEVAVEPELGQSGQRAVGVGVVDDLALARLAPAGWEEALLEVEERVLAAARSAAEVELLESLTLAPGRRLEEDEVRRRRLAAALARSGDVVVQPRRGRKAERGRRELLAEAGLDEDDPLAQSLGKCLPVVRREEVEIAGAEPAHRRVVEGRELGQARRRLAHGDLEAGRPRLAHLVSVLWMQAGEQVELRVERPGDRVGQPLDVDAGGRLPLVGEQRMK